MSEQEATVATETVELDKPVPFRSVYLGGKTKFIEMMSATNIAAWWDFYFGKDADKPPTITERAVELTRRCCVDEAGKREFAGVDPKVMAHDKKLGRFLMEFYSAAQRANGLFENRYQEEAHRAYFFGEQTLAEKLEAATASVAEYKRMYEEILAKTSYEKSESPEGKPTSTESSPA